MLPQKQTSDNTKVLPKTMSKLVKKMLVQKNASGNIINTASEMPDSIRGVTSTKCLTISQRYQMMLTQKCLTTSMVQSLK
jgi:hypothetical protein